jgi:conjugal transfer ATP-binding protein TraC
MLSVDGKDEQMLRTELKMTSPEIAIASELSGIKGAYSEFMIRHKNNSWQIGRLLLDPFSAKLYSTKAEDVAKVQKMRARGISITSAIEALS